MERGVGMVVGLLGILKAGGAYVPLDPSYPLERLLQILRDAEPKLVLCDAAGRATLGEEGLKGIKVLTLDRVGQARSGEWGLEWAEQATTNQDAQQLGLNSRNLAYVIYTSGSTGQPKGVMVEHGNIVNFLASMAVTPGLTSADRLLAVTSISFDIAGLELYLPLSQGAQIVLASRNDAVDPYALQRLLSTHGITIMQATPATWRAMLDANWKKSQELVVLCGGEAMPADLASRLSNEGRSVWNMYGPTETTIWSSCARVLRAQDNSSRPSIGRPIANTKIYLLDKQGHPAPLGAIGEIYIGGRGVARGYLNRAELTAERFLRDPFITPPNARMYKTGDLGRYLPDGSIEFLGRNDHQVKIRGYRIELGEIETRLMEYAGVREAVVIDREDNSGEKRLVAYLVPQVLDESNTANSVAAKTTFSLFYFGAEPSVNENKYRLYLESAKFADVNKFEAIWTPERHFHNVGKLYPNPATLSAALSTITTNVKLRAGSVVVPLHDPVRVAEEWAVVDNLSQGRIGIASASGWHPRDFSFFPQNYADRKQVMLESIQVLQRLWRGEAIKRIDGIGKESLIRIFPEPIQSELPLWLTAGGSEDTFIRAGKLGANLLTHLLGQTIPELAEKIAKYRAARAEAGHDPKMGRVTLMIHAFVGEDIQETLSAARAPFMSYMQEHLDLMRAWAKSLGTNVDDLMDKDRSLAEFAFERYSRTASLIGTPQTCLAVANQLQEVGVDEIACLIDWMDTEKALRALPYLKQLYDLTRASLSRDSLRSYLVSRLPEYMIPAAFVTLEALPRTPNGKLDRKALPIPDDTAVIRSIYEPPQGKIEQTLAGIWSEVLGVGGIGRQSDFFDLGGHSLLAVRLLARVRQAFGVELPTAVLFTKPTLEQLAEAVIEAGAEKTFEALSPILRISREEPLPLSFGQQRLWFLAQLEDVSIYNDATALSLRGEVDASVLRRSLDAIWARHEGLRSVFVVEEGEPRVELLPVEMGLPLIEHDLRGIGDAEAKLKELMIAEAQASFDLRQGPLIRGRLIRMQEQEHVLLLTQHHIVSDGWSMGVLARELGTLYGAFSRGEENPLEPLEIQYPDYAAWQQEWLRGERLEKQSEYWRESLADAPVLLELPTDRPRPEQQSFAGGYVPVVIERDLAERLKELSRRQGTTLYMTLLSGWAAVLSRLSGQAEVVIGTPVANRGRAETEGLIGPFVSTVALRVDMREEPSVAEMLKRVRGVVLGAQEHQDMPFEQVVEMVQPPRHLNHTPVFQVMFSWQNNIGSLPELAGVRVEMLRMPYGAAKFDLRLELAEEGGRIVGVANYAVALFYEATIKRQVGYLLAVLKAMVAEQKQAVCEIDLLSPEERRLLLETWNATEVEYPRHLCVHQLLEQQVKRSPEAVAVVCEDQRLSYAELNREANRLAHHLIHLGVKPRDRVAICVERGAGMVVGLLGILKAGGAYVPLDSGYPSQRLKQILADAHPAILLSDSTGLGALGWDILSELIVVDLEMSGEPDALPPVWAEQPAVNPDVQAIGVTSQDMAYVMYTSGSTGTPKGVMVPHRAISRLVLGSNFIGFSAEEVFLQLAPVSFDAATLEIWGPLLNGAKLALIVGNKVSPEEIGEAIRKYGVTTMWLTAALFHFMAAEHLYQLAPLRQLLAGGDVLSVRHVRKVLDAMPHLRLVNGYGPTENTTFTCCHTITLDSLECRSIPIGRPISNTKVYILDNHLLPVPLGAVGELYAGGAGVACGYLNRPDLTAERFMADPFDGGNGRIYRTGDLARYLPDGSIEFLGRNDHQVKIRGFRIELGEIEARLAEHEWVREGVVVAREDGGGEKRLVAYVVAREETDAGELATILRTHLAGILPEYMVPAAFVAMNKLPLTPNGKLDRKALPGPEGEAYAQPTYEPPQGEIEELLARMWQELLGVERVGRQDHFFELGGHSLLAVRLVARVQQVLGVELPVTTLFARPQLGQLAEAVREAGASGKQEALEAIMPISRMEPMPLSYAQQRLWFLAQMEGVSATYHIPAALRLRGKLDGQALKRSLDAIWARHEGMRSVFVAVEGGPRVELLPVETGLPLIEHDLRGVVDAEERLQKLMMEEANAVFDLGQGPLIRGRLIHLQEEEHVLLLTQHHIVSDGWSMGILARELGALYGAFSRGEENPLEPLGIQYPDYAAWQREWLRGERLEKQREYWREALADAPVVLELPTDRRRPERQSFAGGCVPVVIERELAERLKELSHDCGTTLYMTLLGAWAAVLSRLSGQAEVVIGTPVANRRRAETEELIGFFVNTLALRVDLRGEPSVGEMLKRVRGMVLGAQEHQDMPFEQVVEEVQPPRHLNHTPVFQVMFAWQNQEWNLPQLPGVKVEKEERDYAAIKFDMELDLREEKEGVAGTMRYATALFDETTIKRQAGYLQAVLKAMAAEQQQAVSEIDLLSSEERKLLLETWNATEAEYPKHLCVQQLFEEQVKRTPQTAAVVYEGQTLSYDELNRQANQLAHYLIGLGVKPDDRVGLCVERSLRMVVGLLGILKAGGAYVPLDPSYPRQHLARILQDAAPEIVLLDCAGKEVLAGVAQDKLIKIDGADPIWAEMPEHDIAPESIGLDADDLVYVIYTSGSTGVPKGVMVRHHGVVNIVTIMQNRWANYRLERMTQFASISFDASAKEIFYGLASGITQVLRDHRWLTEPEKFWALCAEERINYLNLPTRLWQSMTRDREIEIPECVRLIVMGGEGVELDAVREWVRRGGYKPALMNAYGPTETTINATLSTVTDEEHWNSIGRPIANTKIYVLDGKQRPVPLGAVGELYVGGAGVACGYLKRPDLTAERFLEDPFDGGNGRMYKTGDVGRYRRDGNIEFLGRNDQQVKIRGYRIELGEIEARLGEHEWVKEAVVVAREVEEGGGEKRLVAYVVAREETDAGELATILRTHLAGILPEYMVPAAFVAMKKLPLTPNGKLDRKALPAPEGEAYGQQGYEEPQGEIEKQLAGMWQELLGIERVGRQDHFFELGGHSLLAVRLVARVQQVLGVELPVTTLFARPQLGQLAEAVREAGASGKQEALEAIMPISRMEPMPLSYAQQRLWFLAQMEGVSATYHIPAALRLRGKLDGQALKRSLDAIWARHEGMRSVFVAVEGGPRVELLPVETGLPLIEHDLRGVVDAEERLQKLMMEEANAVFDLGQGPLIRGRLIRLQEEEHVLLLTQHHIVSDGWSMGILARELGALYGAFSRGEENPLEPLGIQYPDYAAWQREWLRGERLEKQREYWREALADAPVVLELPTDRRRPERQSFAGGCVPVVIERELAERLKELSHDCGTTLYMTLLGAWAAVLSRLSGQAEVVIGTPVANRRRAETEELIGFFVNTLALRVDLRGEPSVGEMLKRVRGMVLGAQEHQDMPFEQVVEEVQPPRHLNHTPVFQVAFPGRTI